MTPLKHKIDFTLLISVTNANPNGDPLNGNRPRQTYDGYGEISDVCIKRKIRNRLQEMGEAIFVQSENRCTDGYTCLHERAENNIHLKKVADGKKTNKADYAKTACQEWIDVRTFGQVFAYKDGTAVGIRGPVSIHTAFSVSPVEIIATQITKSINGEPSSRGKASDTMGMRYRIPFGLYILNGSINCQLAEQTGFSEEDAAKLKEALRTLFENDMSSARPDGSMVVEKFIWRTHNSKTASVSPANVHKSIHVQLKDNNLTPRSIDDYDITIDQLPNIKTEDVSV